MLNRRTQEDTETVKVFAFAVGSLVQPCEKEKLFGLFAAHEYFTLDELAEQTDQPKVQLLVVFQLLTCV